MKSHDQHGKQDQQDKHIKKAKPSGREIFLQTERLVIYKTIPEDFDYLYKLQADPKVMQFMGGPRSREQVQANVAGMINHYEKYGFSLGTVFELKSGLFVGGAGIIYLGYDDTQPDIEVGFAILPEFWGQGYGVELASALIDCGFTNLKLSKLLGVAQPANLASQKVLKKVGMCYQHDGDYQGQHAKFFEITRSIWESNSTQKRNG